MPRKAFFADLEKLRESEQIQAVSDIRRGEDDNFYFRVMVPITADVSKAVEIAAMVEPGLSDYPESHSYRMFLEDDDAPQSVAAVLANLPPMTGCDISTAVLRVAESVILGGTQSQPSQRTGDASDYQEDDDDFDDDDEDFADDPAEMFWFQRDAAASKSTNPIQSDTELFDETAKQRIRLDLAIAKAAGFKVACYGNIFCCPINFHLCLSIRISKLGISDEAMEAWNVKSHEYLMLAFCFKSGYKGLNAMLLERGDLVKYKIGISKTYRLAYTTLTAVFGEAQYERDSWRPTFISKALEELMNERFHQILRNRHDHNLTWAGAERLFHTQSGHQSTQVNVSRQELPPGAYPQVVTYDHLTNPVDHLDHRSFPLVAMQFMLRHFVRCTDFCLVCHQPLDKPVEAIKPYVCDNPLCLYQFMSLGFGPGIEHEILTQPMVVDLLISFAWCAAKARRIAELPKGLGLLVPSLQLMQLKGEDFSTTAPSWSRPFHYYHPNQSQPQQSRAITPPPPTPDDPFVEFPEITMNYDTNQLFFHSDKSYNIATGTWLTVIGKFDTFEDSKLRHHRVIKTFPSHVNLAPPVFVVEEPQNKKVGTLPVKVFKYDQNFDELPNHHAQPSVLMQINLLPSVAEMENYLRHHPSKTLSSWTERLSPAAVGILRWIIASNRACIQEVTDDNMVKHVEGMKQFRFAMGAPDKEHRFTNAVLQTRQRLGLQYPTIMAFHGSPMYNWHGIIREGLHFKEAQHGRAFGHGVYHALEFSTSSSYSGSFGMYHGAFSNQNCWHRSQLLLVSAVAMNEVVNAPEEFVSKSPHLVIQHVDWIQTRFLFVSCKTAKNVSAKVVSAIQARIEQPAPSPEPVFKDGFVQDPKMPINCPGQRRYEVLPLRVGSSWKAKLETQQTTDPRKRKANVLDSPGFDDDKASVMTVDEDAEIFTIDPLWKKFAAARTTASRVTILEETVLLLHEKEQVVLAKKRPSSTGFVPGALDQTTLQKLPPPMLANPSASKAIMAALKQIKTTVETEDIVELGWYVEVEQIDNIFQWIVELHSFPPELPITKQMKQAGMTSVVIEMRFPETFPFAPPFARVIRPKFLPFMSGGGGHVTQGGSICMELLTGSGWSPALSIMNVLLNIRLAMCETEPAAQLDMRFYGKIAASATLAHVIGPDGELQQRRNMTDYGIGEAITAYVRACQVHHWKVPEGFDAWSRTM